MYSVSDFDAISNSIAISCELISWAGLDKALRLAFRALAVLSRLNSISWALAADVRC
jgi:hypothetical protein